MEWKTLKHLNSDVEVSSIGTFRYKSTGKSIETNYNYVNGYYNVIIRDERTNKACRRNVHTLVAMYFINNGEIIPPDKKVAFKNGDLSDYSFKNLHIIPKYHRNVAQQKEKSISTIVNYGDEIYC